MATYHPVKNQSGYLAVLNDIDMENSISEGIIRLYCPDCGEELSVEPDVRNLRCYECGTPITIYWPGGL